MNKLHLTICATLLALTSTLAAAQSHRVPAPPAPSAAPAAPEAPALPADAADAPPAPPAPPGLPALPALPAPPAPPAPPPPPTLDIPDDVLAACEGKADKARIQMTASNGARIAGTCRKKGNVYAFMLESYELNRTRFNRR